MAGRPSEAAVIVQVVDRQFLETDGSTTDRRVMIELPMDLARQGWRLDSIQAVTLTENRTTNHRWNAEVSISVDGQQWFPSTPNDLFAYVTTDAHESQAALTDTTKFCAPFIRINLATSNATGSARESATVSLWLVFNFKT